MPAPPTVTVSSHGGSHIGAIVGGVIGGVALLMLFIGVITYIIRISAAKSNGRGDEKMSIGGETLSGHPLPANSSKLYVGHNHLYLFVLLMIIG